MGDYFIDATLLSTFTSLGAVVRFKPLWSEDLVALLRELEGYGWPLASDTIRRGRNTHRQRAAIDGRRRA